MALSNAPRSGLAVFLGAVQFAFLVVVSEIIDSTASSPHIFGTGNETGYTYSVASNFISDLGANCSFPSGSCYFPPSALLFDSSVGTGSNASHFRLLPSPGFQMDAWYVARGHRRARSHRCRCLSRDNGNRPRDLFPCCLPLHRTLGYCVIQTAEETPGLSLGHPRGLDNCRSHTRGLVLSDPSGRSSGHLPGPWSRRHRETRLLPGDTLGNRFRQSSYGDGRQTANVVAASTP